MTPEDLTVLEQSRRRCSVCRTGRRWRTFEVVRREGHQPVVMCGACRARFGDAAPTATVAEKATAAEVPAEQQAAAPAKRRSKRRRPSGQGSRSTDSSARLSQRTGSSERSARFLRVTLHGPDRQGGPPQRGQGASASAAPGGFRRGAQSRSQVVDGAAVDGSRCGVRPPPSAHEQSSHRQRRRRTGPDSLSRRLRGGRIGHPSLCERHQLAPVLVPQLEPHCRSASHSDRVGTWWNTGFSSCARCRL